MVRPLLRFASLLVFTCETCKFAVRAKDPFCFSREERYDKVKNDNVFEI